MPEQWELIEREAFRSQERSIDLRIALVGAVLVTGPLLIGVALGKSMLGLMCSLGGLNTALAMSEGNRRQLARWGALALGGGTLGVATASVVQDSEWLSVAAALIWCLAWSMLRAGGPSATMVGFVVSAVFIVTNGLHSSSPGSFAVSLVYALGAAAALLVMLAPTPRASDTPTSGDRVPLITSVVKAIRAGGVVRFSALRVGVVVALSVALYQSFHLSYGYWMPLTALAVMQPDAHGTWVKSLQRAVGTVLGAILAASVAVVSRDVWILVVAVLVVSGAMFALRDKGYHWMVSMLTPTVLLMISVVKFQGWKLAALRVANTALGIALALSAVGLTDLVRRFTSSRARTRIDRG
ncbi:MAG: FUSC family protein [Acidimicrobiales bacterium]